MRSALLTSQWKKCGHFQSLKLYEDRLKLYDVVSGNVKEGWNNVLKKTQHPTMHIFVSITIQKTGALSGQKITAGQRTMSGQKSCLSGQTWR